MYFRTFEIDRKHKNQVQKCFFLFKHRKIEEILVNSNIFIEMLKLKIHFEEFLRNSNLRGATVIERKIMNFDWNDANLPIYHSYDRTQIWGPFQVLYTVELQLDVSEIYHGHTLQQAQNRIFWCRRAHLPRCYLASGLYGLCSLHGYDLIHLRSCTLLPQRVGKSKCRFLHISRHVENDSSMEKRDQMCGDYQLTGSNE